MALSLQTYRRSGFVALAMAHLPLAAILLLATLLRTWQLSDNGFGRQYYAAGVRSMMGSWHNFLFNAFDPGGFVSLDKPPVAMWLQVLSAKLFGFSGISMLLPQVLEGLLAIVLVHTIVQRSFGTFAGLAAATLLTVTPIAVAVDRSNNTDSCLILLLLGAAWATIRAVEAGNITYLLASMVLLGVGFNVKMGAAWAVAPVLVGTYLLAGGRADFVRRLPQAAFAGVVLIGVSFAWVAVYDLTPKNRRPYVGGTAGNSMVELVLYHNGLARFVGAAQSGIQESTAGSVHSSSENRTDSQQQPRPALWDDTPTGLLRLLRPHQAAQAAWWLPLALAGIFLGWRSATGEEKAGCRRTQRITITVWAGWAAIYWLVFSFAGGVFHTYYLSVLAAPLAALAGIGAAVLWRSWVSRDARQAFLPVLVAITAVWQSYLVIGQAGISARGWVTWLWLGSNVTAALLAMAMLMRMGPVTRPRPIHEIGVFSLLGAALLVVPLACASSVVLRRPNVAAPVANLAVFDQALPATTPRATERATAAREKLLSFLQQQRGDERFVVAVPNAQMAAPLIIAAGLPVLTMGGYLGSDPILEPRDLARMVEGRTVRFVMIGGFRLTPSLSAHEQAISEWVRATGKPVDPALWRLRSRPSATYKVPLAGQLVTMQRPELYDLRP